MVGIENPLRDDDEERDPAEWRIAYVIGSLLTAVASLVAAVEVVSTAGGGDVVWESAVMVLLVAVPLMTAVVAWKQAWRWLRIIGPLCWLAAVAAVLVATSCRPLSHVRGMQTGGMVLVAVLLITVAVARGGYVPHGIFQTFDTGRADDRWLGRRR